ncbi:hypothetical protein CDCA_CDCA19G4674 [Cyanidium caldarium]|uniref:Ubiquitin carboxyl-terminal hydrolase n=1 Tax=Cyanidium caldarium TaxID=2771 RepID=A0AAV9J2D9_CYACA|nr:hypothetical protein CDCA_CDCA19G4674 [Cyanidium caldarium]
MKSPRGTPTQPMESEEMVRKRENLNGHDALDSTTPTRGVEHRPVTRSVAAAAAAAAVSTSASGGSAVNSARPNRYAAVPAAWYREDEWQRSAMPLSQLVDPEHPRLLRSGLLESVDFVLVPEAEFRKLRERYGADAEPPDLLPLMSNGLVEVRPLRVLIDGRPEFVSQEADICALYDGSLYLADSGEALPRSGTVRDAMITDQTELVTEVKRPIQRLRTAPPAPAAAEPSASSLSPSPSAGLTGLVNLGNTCFMNSAVQCLASTAPLTHYFITQQYRADLNRTNPLGTGGVLAEEYAALVQQLWAPMPSSSSSTSSRSAVAPRRFKYQISRFAPQFSGYAQQDSQELITFLLDGLHEDLNRVRRKPYIAEDPDEEIPPDVAWQRHCARNDSVVVDLFHGQYRSTVRCPDCDRVSVTYDPLVYLSLPLPGRKERIVSVVLWTLAEQHDGTGPTHYELRVPRRGILQTLKERLQQVSGVEAARLALLRGLETNRSVGSGSSSTFLLSPKRRLERVLDSDTLLVIEVADAAALKRSEERCAREHHPAIGLLHAIPDSMRNGVHSTRQATGALSTAATAAAATADEARLVEVVRTDAERNLIGVPLLFTVPPATSEAHLHREVQLRLRRWGIEPEAFEVRPRDGASTAAASHCLYELQWRSRGGDVDTAAVDSTWRAARDRFVSAAHSSHNGAGGRHAPARVDLYQCLHLWSETEVLDEDNLWYCSRCKKHQRASKQLTLYRLPRVLVVHLKRFQYSSWFRDKLEVLVEFPLRDLVLECRGERVAYDLFAVSHHMGGLGGGHYTASCYRDACARWFYLDDAHVSPLPDSEEAAAKRIVNQSAYVLFYRQTDTPRRGAL